MKENFIKKLGLFVLALTLVQTSYAQVTIGSGLVPNAGALLDLKQETDGFSDKGLGMPRVQLQDINKLQMGATAIEHTDKVAHTGLMVYNVSGATLPQCAPIPNGLYVWDGAKWNGVGIKEIAPPNLNLGSKIYFDLPSGRDGRGAITTQNFNVAWSPPQPLPYTNTAAAFGGISFTTTPLVDSPLAASPTVFSMTPDAMTIADPANPWQSKESTLAFTPVDECGGAFTETITLNQTNYAMKVNDSFEDSNILLKDTNPKNFDVQTNNIWKVTVVDSKGILATKIPLTGGADNTTGGESSTTFTYTTSAGGTGSKYQTATLKFEDAHTPKRAKDITVTTMQCQGMPDMGGLDTADPTQTSGNNAWGGKVIRHLAKAGVYEEFLSANFGTAGRWMTTNLVAWKYDEGVTYTGGDPTGGLNLHPANTAAIYNRAWYTYPGDHIIQTNEGATIEFTTNPHLGLLYTWDAATAGKGGATGQLNLDNSAGNIANNESGFPEGLGANEQKRRQGVCPNGWHLPSDYEWTELERVIIEKTTQYTSYTQNIVDTDGYGSGTAEVKQPDIPGTGNEALRGTHLQAMVSTCNGNDAAIGKSNIPTQGGFDIFFAGRAVIGSSDNYGIHGQFSTSSSFLNDRAWFRGFSHINSPAVVRMGAGRYILLSVRCKKD